MKQIQTPTSKKMMQKRIPTWFGLIFLVVALGVGVFFIGKGPGIFAPRATPETTPKKVKVTNITDNSFTLSFLTDEDVAGFVKYGTTANDLKSQASDDRDQLSGSVEEYQTHHITVRGLSENATYYYVLGTGSGSTFDNNGSAFQVKTARRSGAPPAAKMIHGTVTNQAGGPADGAIVYISLEGAGEMSSLVKNSGSWAVPLSNTRTLDGSAYATIEDSSLLKITAQGVPETMFATVTVDVANAQPVQSLTLGAGAVAVAPQSPSPDPESEITDLPPDDQNGTEDITEDPDSETNSATESGDATSSGGLSDLANSPVATSDADTSDASPSAIIVDIDAGNGQEVDTTQPTIIGKAAPQTKVTIQVNSETQITSDVTTNANGEFELDLSALGKELEPGEHTVTYSYIDPVSGEEISKTVTFQVAQSATAIVSQANASTTPVNGTGSTNDEPFGSGNPYPASPTPTPEPTPTPDATDSGESTRSGMPSTESGVPVSGSVGTTMALVFGGMFFIVSGLWSFWISSQLNPAKIKSRDEDF